MSTLTLGADELRTLIDDYARRILAREINAPGEICGAAYRIAWFADMLADQFRAADERRYVPHGIVLAIPAVQDIVHLEQVGGAIVVTITDGSRLSLQLPLLPTAVERSAPDTDETPEAA